MKILTLLSCISFLTSASALAASRTSASYSIATETIDSAGAPSSSTNYKNDATAGGITGVSAVASPAEVVKAGYVAQLYEIVGLAVTSAQPSVNEGASIQLQPRYILDDSTFLTLDPTLVTWGAPVEPIASISGSGVATAQTVYQDTPASVQGTLGSYTGTYNLTVINVVNDDFGSYAGDGIDDSWQVQYFGQPPNSNAAPNVDFDHTGQTNLFKFVAGLNPLDGSRFLVSTQSVPGQPSQKYVIFSPIVGGRTYIVQSVSSPASSAWAPLPQMTQTDNGPVRTVTDLNALPAPRFYRVQISKP